MTTTRSNVIQWAAVAVVSSAVGIGTGYWWAHRSMPSPVASAGKSERKILYWHDPMVPGQKFDSLPKRSEAP